MDELFTAIGKSLPFVLYTLANLLGFYLVATYKKTAFWILLAIGLFFPWGAHVDDWDWFAYAKRYSVLIPLIIYQAIIAFRNPRSGFLTWKYFPLICHGIIILNILEAVLKAYELGHIANAMAGLVLVVTLESRCWFVSQKNLISMREDIYLTLWVVLYTLWNFNFFFFSPEFENSTFLAIVTLGVSLWASLLTSFSNWFFYRVYSLGFVVLFDSLFNTNALYPSALFPENRISTFGNEFLSLLLLTFLLPLVWYRVQRLRRKPLRFLWP